MFNDSSSQTRVSLFESRCFPAVNFGRPKFKGPVRLNWAMASRRMRSSLRASSAGNLDGSTSDDAPKPLKNASKASTGRSGVLEDESEVIEKMTLQQMKSRLRNIGIPPEGEDSLVLQYQEIPEEKSAVRKTNSKRKAKGLSESDHIQITNDGSDISRGKRKKIQVEKSSEESVHMKSRQSTTEKELISQSTEIEGGRTKKKVSSRTTMSNIKARVKVDLSEDEPWTVLTHKKPQKGWAAYNPKIMRPPPITADVPHVKLMSWNVNGLRALLKLESFSALELAQRENFDVLCLQETKLQDLEQSKPVILTGDLNCAHQEIDIWNPAGNRRSAGFTDEERQSFQTNFLDRGFVDTFRKQHPDVVGYTYWGYRHGGRKTNKGWRLDYFLASESIIKQVYDSYILPDVAGSDHSPIGLILKL
ncbi:UNVERIFIED_CONTAM: DNA-(apurinic or apyrimidinic site) lyase, chloroplastic [Sesamum calycinum]|uniref:DNA-(apurinic or apyrimidinic site) endonuclease n=1 Tax=Sesamum calycinum TaxID=2727403 RepID=A0AAW2N2G3_9LAMI